MIALGNFSTMAYLAERGPDGKFGGNPFPLLHSTLPCHKHAQRQSIYPVGCLRMCVAPRGLLSPNRLFGVAGSKHRRDSDSTQRR